MTTTDPVDDSVRDWVRNLIVLAIKELKIVCKNRNQEEHFQLFAEALEWPRQLSRLERGG